MNWWVLLPLILCSMMFLFLLGVPVAFTFLFINIIGFYLFAGGEAGIGQLVLSVYSSVSTFSLLPVPLFILMGEVMFRSGVAHQMMDTLDKWLGRTPGRLSLLAVGGGTVFATLSGSSMAGAAMLGSVLIPEMIRRGYRPAMSLGPVLGCGGLAIMIPPSILGVVLAAMGKFSVGDFLIAIIVPGLFMALCRVAYIVLRCLLHPQLAPSYDVESRVSFPEKLRLTVRYVLPLGTVVFLVVGLVFLGVATPSEAAACGGTACFILAFIYNRGLKWETVKESMVHTTRISVMMFMIFTGAAGFSQILVLTGATEGLVGLVANLTVSPMVVILSIMAILLMLGTFMESIAIIMVTIPIFMPIIHKLGLNPLWIGTVMLICLEIGIITPPFGMVLFVVRGVVPKETNITMWDIYTAAFPWICIDLFVVVVLLAFPGLTLWLPNLLR